MQLKEKTLTLELFKKRDKQVNAASNNNLYIKNLPEITDEEGEIIKLKESLSQFFGKFGEIQSILVKVDPIKKLPFAFIAYKDADVTNEAILQTND